LPRAAARNQPCVTGGNTSLSAMESASGGSTLGAPAQRAGCDAPSPRARCRSSPAGCRRRRERSVRLGTGDWGLGTGRHESRSTSRRRSPRQPPRALAGRDATP
jgi:hypothetical protein